MGHPAPLRKPALNGQVMGQDTVVAVPYRGKIYYSIRADLTAEGLTRSAQPIGRVWRNPLRALVLDRGVEPVEVPTGPP